MLGRGGDVTWSPPCSPNLRCHAGPLSACITARALGSCPRGCSGPALFLVPFPDCFLLLCLLSSRSPWLQRAQVIAPLQLAALPMCSLSCDCVVETIS